MSRDGELLTPAQMRELEKQADEILRQDAIKQGSRTGRRRSFSPYAEKYGLMTSTHTKHEKTGFSEQQLESLAHGTDNIVHEVGDE